MVLMIYMYTCKKCCLPSYRSPHTPLPDELTMVFASQIKIFTKTSKCVPVEITMRHPLKHESLRSMLSYPDQGTYLIQQFTLGGKFALADNPKRIKNHSRTPGVCTL